MSSRFTLTLNGGQQIVGTPAAVIILGFFALIFFAGFFLGVAPRIATP